MMKKAIMITWNGFQDQEVIYPYYRLKEDGFTVDIMAEKVGPITGLFGIKFDATYTTTDFQYNDILNSFDIMVLPGGVKALEKLRQESKVIELIHQWNINGKIIASTCHGAQLLISAKVVSGRDISGYYSIKDDIENAGGIYSYNGCVIDNNIISSPHYKYMGEWMHGALSEYYKRNK
jgi:protease I